MVTKTTPEQILRAVEINEPNRFDLAGRILALSLLWRDDAMLRDEGLILERIAGVCALQGPEAAYLWVQGVHYSEGVRMHGAWTSALRILSVGSGNFNAGVRESLERDLRLATRYADEGYRPGPPEEQTREG